MSYILLILTFLLIGYFFIKKRFQYWSDTGVISVKGKFPLGNLQGLGKKYNIAEIIDKLYKNLKSRVPFGFGGIYFFIDPVALITDIGLIKSILVKDFQYFHDRGMFLNEKDDPIAAHLFNIEGLTWKNLRTKLTPTFTSGKMKMMFPTIVTVGEQFRDYIAKSITTNPEIEIKDVLSRFTTDVIGNCAFGLECDSLNNPDSEFRKMGKKAIDSPRHGALATFAILQFREFARSIGIKETSDDVAEFFLRTVKETIDYREQNNIERNDFMNLLINLKNSKNDAERLTVNEISAQAFLFFLAGFETSSTAMLYAMYELSLNQELQDKARQSITDTLQKFDGKITYEAVSEMAYIDQCINESLRKYPPVPMLNRVVTKDYDVPNSTYILKKNINIVIPVYSIQHDPEYYPEPEKYKPERFSSEEVANRNPYTFLPFGEGPRVCIGLRFGMMQARIGLAILLKNYKFTPTPRTPSTIVFDKENFLLAPISGVYLKIEKL